MQQPAVGPAEVMGMFCLLFGFILIVALIVGIFYLLTLQKALNRVAPHNRLMEPGSVWLMLVPCVNVVWQFLIAIRVPDSLRNEFRERGQDDGSDYGKSIALTQAILGLIGAPFNMMSSAGGERVALGANVIVLILSLVGLALFIVFWVRIANYSSRLAVDDRGRRDWERRFDDDDDDRGPPSGVPRVPPPETFREGDPGAIKP